MTHEDSAGTFENLDSTKFKYFNRYSDKQLDEIYKADPKSRDIIDRVREYRRKSAK